MSFLKRFRDKHVFKICAINAFLENLYRVVSDKEKVANFSLPSFIIRSSLDGFFLYTNTFEKIVNAFNANTEL